MIAPIAVLVLVLWTIVPTLYLLSAVSPAVLVAVAYSWRKTGLSLFNPYILFFSAAFMYNAGLTLAVVSGLNIHVFNNAYLGATVNTYFTSQEVALSLLYALVGLVFLHFGALLVTDHIQRGRALTRRMELDVNDHPRSHERPSKAMWEVGLVLVAIAIIPALLSAHKLLALKSNAPYIALYQAGGASGIGNLSNILGGLLLPGAIMLIVGAGRKRPWLSGLGIALAMGLVLSWLLVGIRGFAFLALAATVWSVDARLVRIPRAFLWIGIILLVVVSSFISSVRANTGLVLGQGAANQITFKGAALATIEEFGSTQYTLTATQVLVPSKYGYRDGRDYANAVVNVIPDFVTGLHPVAPDTWLTRVLDPVYANAGGGLGFSMLAESYLEFGWFGLIAVLFVGAGVARLLFVEKNSSTKRILVAALSMAVLLQLPRAEALGYVRNVVYYVGGPLLLLGLWTSLRRVPSMTRGCRR